MKSKYTYYRFITLSPVVNIHSKWLHQSQTSQQPLPLIVQLLYLIKVTYTENSFKSQK